jgi:transcriptional regulator with XRE-family HTH domain
MSVFQRLQAMIMPQRTKDRLRQEFSDQDYRYAYAEDFLNASVATQIRVLREQREMTQGQLADAIGTKQAGISRLENVNYSGWKTRTLLKIARALGVRLKITFEDFGSLLEEAENFSREALQRPDFEHDEAFSGVQGWVSVPVSTQGIFVITATVNEMTQAAAEQAGQTQEHDEVGRIQPAVLGWKPASSGLAHYSIQ